MTEQPPATMWTIVGVSFCAGLLFGALGTMVKQEVSAHYQAKHINLNFAPVEVPPMAGRIKKGQ